MKALITRWIIFNIFLFAVSIGLGAAHYPTDFDGLRCPYYEGDTLAECFQFGALLGTVSGLVIGVGQAVFLRKQLGWGRNQLIGWVIATTAAFAFGHAIGDSAPVPQVLPWSALGLGLVSGLGLGSLQWLVLRGRVENVSHWITQSTIGFGIGLGLVGIAAMLLLDKESRLSVFGWHTMIDLLIFIILDGLFIGGIWAWLTGRVIFKGKIEMIER